MTFFYVRTEDTDLSRMLWTISLSDGETSEDKADSFTNSFSSLRESFEKIEGGHKCHKGHPHIIDMLG